MNPSAGPTSIPWSNPPPPGTEQESPELPDIHRSSDERDDAGHQERPIDRIDPYLKNPIYRGREEQFSIDRLKYKTRSITPEYRHRRHHSRHHSRSKSKEKRSHGRRHKRYSSSSRSKSRGRSSFSRSHSRSPVYRHKHSTKKHSRHCSTRSKSRSLSYSRSRTRSRSRSHVSSTRHHRRHHQRSSPSSRYRKTEHHYHSSRHSSKTESDRIRSETVATFEQPPIQEDIPDSPVRKEEEDDDEQPAVPFKNDGTFLEMFKKLQEEKQQQPAKQTDTTKPVLPAFGKRRGGKVLKTGRVQKIKTTPDNGSCSNSNSQDAWSVYMNEVRKYKEACCDDDSKTRPLMK